MSSIHAALANLREIGGEEFVTELVEQFEIDVGERLHESRAAIAGRDVGTLERAAHTLKSTSMQMGLDGFAALFRNIEALSRKDRVAEIGPVLAEAERAWSGARVDLRRAAGLPLAA